MSLSSFYISSTSNKGLIENISISKIVVSEKCYSYRQEISEEIFVNLSSYNYDYDRSGDYKDLCDSISQNGLLYPLIVRMVEDCYELLAGRRRLIACKRLGWRKVLCNVIEATDKEAYEISLIENIHTRKIDTIEEAEAFRRYVFEYGWGGISELASKINKSKSYITKKIKMLDLPENVLSFVNNGVVSPTVAEELLSVDDKTKQSQLAQMIKDKQLSKSKVRELVTEFKEADNYDYDFTGTYSNAQETRIIDIDKKAHRSFEQAITALRLAMNKLSTIIEDNEDNWIIYERLMHSKLSLHQQIDLLIKDRKKL
ncbi:MAG: ParB/RepB/Spo0J family partition protein [Candidatus Nitrosocosmicus sp.]|nr:ParB/RepB/Spo0J family partition protein [Candidatus Nitrosocosmicus sp.]